MIGHDNTSLNLNYKENFKPTSELPRFESLKFEENTHPSLGGWERTVSGGPGVFLLSLPHGKFPLGEIRFYMMPW
jgi:hypothetical protein